MFELIAYGVFATIGRFDANTVNGVFIVASLLLFLIALALSAAGRAPAFCRAMPTVLTTIGILGTFLGIAIGLLHFDVARIEFSIPVLLDGLKLAFISSIVGIVLSVFFRFVLILGYDAGADTVRGTPRVATLAARQVQLAEAQLTLTQRLVEQLAAFDDRLTATVQTQHRALLATLDGFAGHLSEMGSRQLIAALETVIRDFNAKLGDQFGENFRQLDTSVAKLLEWQERYRAHLEQLGERLDHATAGAEKSAQTLDALTQQALRISHHVTDQEAVMAQLRRETMELEALLSVIAELRDKAKDAFPAMDRRLTVMLETIEQSVLAAQRFDPRLQALPISAPPVDPSRAASTS